MKIRSLILLGVLAFGLPAVAGPVGEPAARPELRLKRGDVVRVVIAGAETPYAGEYEILSDGAVYGPGFGRLVLEGKTYAEAERAVRAALAPFVQSRFVYLTIRQERQNIVYLLGQGAPGAVPLLPETTLQKVLGQAKLDEDADILDVQLLRGGEKLVEGTLRGLLRGSEPGHGTVLEPGDVAVLLPREVVRVWVTGSVNRPGRLRLPAGSNAYQAVAEAGGLAIPESPDRPIPDDEYRIRVLRGPSVLAELSARARPEEPGPTLESGDVITVLPPRFIRFTVTGEVESPGEFTSPEGVGVTGAIARAGGPSERADRASALVFREGRILRVDLAQPGPGPRLEEGDIVFVPRNERAFYVLGEVARPGRFLMDEGRRYRASDALAEAGGTTERGSLRRVYLVRAGALTPEGTRAPTVIRFDLDEFLKDGRLEANPVLEPGDTLLFGTPRGITLGGVSQVASSFVIFDSLFRR